MKKKLKWALIAAGAFTIVGGAFIAGHAWASGIPTSGALTYSGLLQDATGAPLSGTEYIEVKFWNDVTASDAVANLLCDSGTPAVTPLVSGHFSIPLPDKCTSSVGSNAGIWAEVLVGPALNSVGSLGRAKLGAVPYAVEADHAANAANATHATTADTAGIGSAFRAYRTTTFSVMDSVTTPIVFDAKNFDLGSEYSTSTGVFTSKNGGYYSIRCNLRYEDGTAAPGVQAWWSVQVFVNGAPAFRNGFWGSGFSAFRLAASTVHLNAMDQVSCLANFQGSGGSRSVFGATTIDTFFEAVRLPM